MSLTSSSSPIQFFSEQGGGSCLLIIITSATLTKCAGGSSLNARILLCTNMNKIDDLVLYFFTDVIQIVTHMFIILVFYRLVPFCVPRTRIFSMIMIILKKQRATSTCAQQNIRPVLVNWGSWKCVPMNAAVRVFRGIPRCLCVQVVAMILEYFKDNVMLIGILTLLRV